MGRNFAMLKAESTGDAGERIRPMDGDAFNPIQWWVKKLEDQPTVAQYSRSTMLPGNVS